MKTKNIKRLIKYSDKKSLRKMCFGLLKMLDGYEIENYCLRENMEKQRKEFESQIFRERIRADSKESLSESLNGISMKLIEAVEKFVDLSSLNERQEEANDEKNNSQATETY